MPLACVMLPWTNARFACETVMSFALLLRTMIDGSSPTNGDQGDTCRCTAILVSSITLSTIVTFFWP